MEAKAAINAKPADAGCCELPANWKAFRRLAASDRGECSFSPCCTISNAPPAHTGRHGSRQGTTPELLGGGTPPPALAAAVTSLGWQGPSRHQSHAPLRNRVPGGLRSCSRLNDTHRSRCTACSRRARSMLPADDHLHATPCAALPVHRASYQTPKTQPHLPAPCLRSPLRDPYRQSWAHPCPPDDGWFLIWMIISETG